MVKLMSMADIWALFKNLFLFRLIVASVDKCQQNSPIRPHVAVVAARYGQGTRTVRNHLDNAREAPCRLA
jgi:hypothetical protein